MSFIFTFIFLDQSTIDDKSLGARLIGYMEKSEFPGMFYMDKISTEKNLERRFLKYMGNEGNQVVPWELIPWEVV